MLGFSSGHVLMILFNQSDVQPNFLIGNKGYINGNRRRLPPVGFQKLSQPFIQSFLTFKKLYINFVINDNTSMIRIAVKTLTMPRDTTMGTLVNSCEARRPK
jgi:hypothetical protein